MTPVPFDLPLRPSEAAEAANLVFELAGGRALTDDVRNRVASRAAVLGLQSISPHFGSLARDPVHNSSYYLAVDVTPGPPLLLHFAPATAPTTSIFPKPLLIGRMRLRAGAEVVINAIPFSVEDTANLDRFSLQVDKSFLPRPQGARSAIVATAGVPAFAAFRAILKRTGKNVAAVRGPFYEGLWAAIRAGWREGYSAVADGARDPRSSRFAAEVWSDAGSFVGSLTAAAALRDSIRQTRSAAKIPGTFDFEICFRGPEPTTAEDLEFCLHWLAERGQPAQFAAPANAKNLAALAEVALRNQSVLSIHATDDLEAVARETNGRVSYECPEASRLDEVARTLIG